jgi:HK97 family phage major capsid protein
MDVELGDLHDKWKEATELDRIEAGVKSVADDVDRINRTDAMVAMGGGRESRGPARRESLGERAIKSLYRRDRDGNIERDSKGPVAVKNLEFEVKDYDLDLEMKTTMTTAAGLAPDTIRSSRLVYTALRAPMVADLLPTIPVTTGNSYTYMQESTFTNNAAEVAEAGTYPESALAYTEVTATVRKIGTWIPVTDEQLADVPGMRALIDNRLSLMVQLRLDTELISGDGIAPNISGFMTQVTQSQAKGSDPVFDALYKGMVLVQTVGFANVTGIVMHPLDWQDVRLTRTTDGVYILGNPADPGPERIFGVPVVMTTGATQNTAIVGDFAAHSALIYRQGIEIKITDSHSDLWVKDIQAIKASLRAALAVFRLTAFCKVTGV